MTGALNAWTSVEGLGARVLVRRSGGLIDGIEFVWQGHTVRCEADASDPNPRAKAGPEFAVWRLVTGPPIAAWVPGSAAPDAETLREWIIARLEAKYGRGGDLDDAKIFGEPTRASASSELGAVRSLGFRLVPRAKLPDPDDAARRLSNLADRLASFAGCPVTWGIGAESSVTLSAIPGRADVSEDVLLAFLGEFEAEAHELGFRVTKEVIRD